MRGLRESGLLLVWLKALVLSELRQEQVRVVIDVVPDDPAVPLKLVE